MEGMGSEAWSLFFSPCVGWGVSYLVVNADDGLSESGMICIGGVERIDVIDSLHGLCEHL